MGLHILEANLLYLSPLYYGFGIRLYSFSEHLLSFYFVVSSFSGDFNGVEQIGFYDKNCLEIILMMFCD